MCKFLYAFNCGFTSLLISKSNLLSMESLAIWLHPGDSYSQQLISISTLASKEIYNASHNSSHTIFCEKWNDGIAIWKKIDDIKPLPRVRVLEES